MDRTQEIWISQGLEGDYLATREKTEAERHDLRIEYAREMSEEAGK